MNQHPLIERDKIAPVQALDLLIEGNLRFTSNISVNKDLLQVANMTKDRQQPFAAILSCSDSRTASELIFDQSLGDIFSVRLAGNIACNKAIGSLEYACRHLGSKLVVVLGHTRCGAVLAACDHVSSGHIGEIASLIAPAVARETGCREQRNSGNLAFVDRVCELNVALQMERILTHSDMLRELLQARRIGLVGGLYDLETAITTFPRQFRWFCLEDANIQQATMQPTASLGQGGRHATA